LWSVAAFSGSSIGIPTRSSRGRRHRSREPSFVPEGRRGITDDQVRAEFGTPDEEDDTLHDHPRPPLVTKWMIYKSQRVRFTFVTKGTVSRPELRPWVGDDGERHWRASEQLDPTRR
jgi:hypothetical protein